MRYLLALLIFFIATVDAFDWNTSLAPGLSGKNAIIYLILLGLAFRFVVRGGMRIELRRVHLWLGVLVAYALLTWLIAGTIIQYQSYELLPTAIDLKSQLLDNVIVFGLYLYGTRSQRDCEFLLKCDLLAVAAANALAIGNVAGVFAIGATFVGNEGNLVGRVFGAFGHANETAALIVTLLPAYVAVTLSSRGFARVFWAAAGIVGGAMLVLTGSRSGFIALTMSLLCGSYLCRNLISWRRAATIAVPIGVAAVAVLAVVSARFDNVLVQRVLQSVLSPGTSSYGRTYIWMPIINMMAANPITLLTGFGWDVYSVMGFRYAAHNQYLLLWFELGIVGLFSWVMLMVQLLLVSLRGAKIAPRTVQPYLVAFVYGMCGLLVAVAFGLLFHPWPYIWIYIGLTMRMALLAARPNESQARNPRDASATAPAAVARRAARRLPATERGGS